MAILIQKKIAPMVFLFLALLTTGVADAKNMENIYHITMSDTHNFIWFRNAKVCTRTILEVLCQHAEISLSASNVVFDKKACREYFKFAFVRNPWDRVVSCYANKVANSSHYAFRECFGKDFNYFVEFISKQNLSKTDRHIQLQKDLFPAKELHFIGRFENFEEDFKLVLNALGIKNAVIPHKNISNHRHYSTYYNEKTKAMIASKYKEDIELFGYRFEDVEEVNQI